MIEVAGILLRQQDYKDKDALIQLATPDYGRLTVLAKSLRSITSKQTSYCQPFISGKWLIDYHELKSIHMLTGGEVLQSRRQLREDLYRSSFATCMAEVCEYLLELEPEGAYEELRAAYEVMQTTTNPALCFALYLARACRLFGIEPYVDGCVSCGSESRICAISIFDGGFICEDCYEYSMPKKTVDFLRCFRMLMKAGYEHLDKIPFSQEVAGDVALFILEFIKEHSSFGCVSEKFIREVLHL